MPRLASHVALALLIASPLCAQGSLLDVHDHAGVEALGAAVAGAGDVNADGFTDLVVGAPRTMVGAIDLVGSAYVVTGQDGAATFQFYGQAKFDLFGSSVAGVGDVDGDGLPDVAISAPQIYSDPLSYVQLRSGADGHLIRQLDEPPGNLGAFGQCVAGAGDADADGWPDILVGGTDSGGQLSYVRLYSGATGAMLFELEDHPTPPFASSGFGDTLSGVGDADDDGHDDFAAGTPEDGTVQHDSGAALVLSGKDGHQIRAFFGEQQNGLFGNCVAGSGDVDGDGRGDLLVGARGQNGTHPDSGIAYVYSLRDGGLIHEFVGQLGTYGLGTVVAAAGDVDDDGHADLLVSAGDSTPIGACVFVFSGSDGSQIAKLHGGDTWPTAWHAPIATASVGDFNRNGSPDVAVGLPKQGVYPAIASELHVFELGCGDITSYGTACSGSLGSAPALLVSGCASPAGTLTLAVSGVPPAAQVLLLVGAAPADVALPGGCVLRVAPLIAQLAPPAGTVLEAKLPPYTVGFAFALQAVVFAGSPTSLAMSQGVQVVID